MNSHSITMARDKLAVIVDLKVAGNADAYSERSFVLRAPAFAMSIGRSSSTRDGKYLPQKDNGWFESRVVSREHAVIKAFPDMKAVFLEDVGSMHGTFINEHRVKLREKQMLAMGDCIRFGTDVSRGPETFPPLRASIEYRWINERTANLPAEIQRAFEAYDEDSEVEFIEESHRKSKFLEYKQPQTFTVPDSDVSAAGSFFSEDDPEELEELPIIELDEIPSSARRLLKDLNRTPTDEQVTTEIATTEQPSSQTPAAANETSESMHPEANSEASHDLEVSPQPPSTQAINGNEPANFVNVDFYPGADDNLTESDSESRYSDDYGDLDEDDLDSENSELTGVDQADESLNSFDAEQDDIEHALTDVKSVDAAGLASNEETQKRVVEATSNLESTKVHNFDPETACYPARLYRNRESSPVKDSAPGPSQIRPPSPSDAAMPKSNLGSVGFEKTQDSPGRNPGLPFQYSNDSYLNPYFSYGAVPNYNSHLYSPTSTPYPTLTTPFTPCESVSPRTTGVSTRRPFYPSPYQYGSSSAFHESPLDIIPPYQPKPMDRDKLFSYNKPTVFAHSEVKQSSAFSRAPRKISIDEMVITSDKPAPAPKTNLKRKADAIENESNVVEMKVTEENAEAATTENNMETSITVTENQPTTSEASIPTTVVTEVSIDERPAKRVKTSSEKVPARKMPSFVKYSAVASLGFTMGIVGTFWTLVTLPDNFFLQQN